MPTLYLLRRKRVAWPAGSTTSGNLWLNLSNTTAFSRQRSSAGKPIPCTKQRTKTNTDHRLQTHARQ